MKKIYSLDFQSFLDGECSPKRKKYTLYSLAAFGIFNLSPEMKTAYGIVIGSSLLIFGLIALERRFMSNGLIHVLDGFLTVLKVVFPFIAYSILAYLILTLPFL